MNTLSKQAENIFRAALKFEKLADKPVQSAQPADIQTALQRAGLFGGKAGSKPPASGKYYSNEELEFDPNSPTAKKIFSIMDNMNPPYEGKMKADLLVSPKGAVTILVTGDRAKELGPLMQKAFGSLMSRVLVSKRILPSGDLKVKWLIGVG